MIDLLKEKIKNLHSTAEKYNFLREYLQLLILKIIDEQSFFNQISFLGGTALRILYGLNRYSEDLDFNVLDTTHYDFKAMLEKIASELQLMGLSVSMQIKNQRTVAMAQIKFSELLFQLGVSPLKDQKIMIKFEVDQNPPAGFKHTLTMMNTEFLLNIGHLDLPSMYSGKLLAIICRNYTKGRDYYDLMWYLAKRTLPNLTYFNAGLEQHHFSSCINLAAVKDLLINKMQASDFHAVLTDLEPFLIDLKERRFFTKNHFINLIASALSLAT